MGSSPPAGAQFLRAASLLLLNETSARDLSNLRFRFQILANDVETPNTAQIRVYNLSEQTTAQAIAEFSSVVVSAGYQSNGPGQIFKGTIKQFRRGKERNIDSFLDIFAADSDAAYNFGIVNTSLPAGSTEQQRFQTLVDALGLPSDPTAPSYLNQTGGILPRGKVLFGLARSYMADLAVTNNVRWSIQNGVVTLIPLAGYLPGEAVVINSATGMIGVPEVTEQGIIVTALLNPQIKIGRRIQLNNKDITAAIIKQQFFPGYQDFNQLALVSGQTVSATGTTSPVDSSADGFYRVVVIEYIGDTRGQEWYSKLTCLKTDPSSPADSSVQPYMLPVPPPSGG